MSAKKLINRPVDVVEEAVDGLVATHPVLLRRLSGLHVIVRADYEAVKETQVALISGGGSGHEPAHAGYVGPGMLSAAICGGVFASPSVSSILAGIRCVTGSKGCLLIIKNYTGDRLNFGLAAEQARAEGLKVAMVIVGDDCALPKSKGITGRRGVAGTVFVHKVAGAAAASGCPLEQVTREASACAEAMGTLGTTPSTRLAGDMVELGLGIHGEPGIERTPIMPADQLVDRMLLAITGTEAEGGHDYLPLSPSESVVLLVNNLGGTPPLEISIVTRRALQWLESKHVTVDRVFTGHLVTSLEMAGVSITLLKVDPLRLARLDASTHAPGWVPTLPRPPQAFPQPIPPPVQPSATDASTSSHVPPQVLELYVKAASAVAQALINAKDELNALDAATGDGDCGVTLLRGGQQVLSVLPSLKQQGTTQFLIAIAEAVSESMGGTSGALLEIFFRTMSRSMQEEASGGVPNLEAWTRAVEAGVDAMSLYGGAKAGHRTMLDAWFPAVASLKSDVKAGATSGAQAVAHAAVEAEKGVERTKSMTAQAGRSNYVPSSATRGIPDPGALAVAYALKALSAALH